MLNASERTLTFKELTGFADMDVAREYIVEKEVESVIRKSHEEQFDWMESKFNLPLRKGLDVWPVFIEVTERRNLFVHCSGIVSSQYMAVCKENKVNLPQELAVGKELRMNSKYFAAAHEAIFEVGVKLAHVLWRKIEPEVRRDADNRLNLICLRLIEQEKYRLAIKLLDFATEVLKTYASDQDRRIFIVNRAQAYKWSGDDAKAKEILKNEDWSATGDGFRLAVSVLEDRFEESVELMKRIGANSAPNREHYRFWPIFKEFRKTDGFKATFASIFGTPFDEGSSQETVKPEEAGSVASVV